MTTDDSSFVSASQEREWSSRKFDFRRSALLGIRRTEMRSEEGQVPLDKPSVDEEHASTSPTFTIPRLHLSSRARQASFPGADNGSAWKCGNDWRWSSFDGTAG